MDARETRSYAEIARYYREQRRTVSPDGVALQPGAISATLLFYELQSDVQRAYYDYYLSWAEDAIRNHDIDLDMRLRNELLRFLSPLH